MRPRSILQHLQVENLLLSKIKSHPNNPRVHSKKQEKQLAESMRRFGVCMPLLVDKDNQLITGHCRQLAAKRLGLTELPVIRLEHLTEAEKLAFMIADNKLTENAGWDRFILSELFVKLDKLELDFSPEITGFDLGEIDLMLQEYQGVVEEEEPLPSPGPTVSRPGDLWQLDEHRILCGNSLEGASFDILMQSQTARMVFTDPPYNVQISGHVSGMGKVKHREFAMASGEMTQEAFTDFLRDTFRLMTKHCKNGAILYVCIDWRHLREILAAADALKLELKNVCVWVKDNAGMGTFYRSQHEFVCVFKHGTARHVNNFELGQNGRYRTNVWKFAGGNSFARNTEEGNTLAMHPTVKPVTMVEEAIMDCSKRGEIVLDPFLGSGSTLIAAERAGRVCYGIEIDPAYVDTAIRRWQQRTGRNAVHVETGLTFDELAREREVRHG